MQIEALKQIIEWTPKAIQDYCKAISIEASKELSDLGCSIEDEAHRTHHLFGFKLPEDTNLRKLKAALLENQIYVSFRGDFMRISSHLYNTKSDFETLVHCIKTNL